MWMMWCWLAVDFVAAAGGPREVVAADLNRDGRPDLVVAGERDIITLLNEKTGWREASRLGELRPASDLAAADFNGDGVADVAVTDHDTFAVTILLGDGRGGWKTGGLVRAKASGKPHIHGLAAGDLNGDKRVDLLLASSEEGEVVPLWNDGQGAFKPGVPVKLAANVWHLALADFNGDGKLDVTAATFGGKGIVVALGDGKGGFAHGPGSPHDAFPRSFLVKAADVNGDGHTDVFGVHDDHGRLTVLLGDGKGRFRQMAGSPFDIGREAYGVEAIDFDGDGRVEIAVAAGNELRVLRGGTNFAVRASGVGSYRMIAADFDGDGRRELAIPDGKTGSVMFFR